MHFSQWFLWAFVLILQNFAFTFVSRARNSGSLKRHLIASIFSNGVWFISQLIIFNQMLAIMTGKYGTRMAIFTSAFYTVFTMVGSLTAHYYSLQNEKGKAAVGASKKYAQIPTEEWLKITNAVEQLAKPVEKVEYALKGEFDALKEKLGRVAKIADEAHLFSAGAIPVSPISATKMGDVVVATGMPK
jgi:hypothetical protein